MKDIEELLNNHEDRIHDIFIIRNGSGDTQQLEQATLNSDKVKAEILKQITELKQKVSNAKKDKDEAVKSVRIQYDSVCDMFHKREREYEDRITDLNNALINQLETGKQKTIYINQLEKENERLKNDGWVKRVYQLEHQLEDMKCCGNCYNFYQGTKCPHNYQAVNNICNNYDCDNLTRKVRETMLHLYESRNCQPKR